MSNSNHEKYLEDLHDLEEDLALAKEAFEVSLQAAFQNEIDAREKFYEIKTMEKRLSELKAQL